MYITIHNFYGKNFITELLLEDLFNLPQLMLKIAMYTGYRITSRKEKTPCIIVAMVHAMLIF